MSLHVQFTACPAEAQAAQHGVTCPGTHRHSLWHRGAEPASFKGLYPVQIRCAEALKGLWSLISTESRQERLQEHKVPLGETPDSTSHPQGNTQNSRNRHWISPAGKQGLLKAVGRKILELMQWIVSAHSSAVVDVGPGDGSASTGSVAGHHTGSQSTLLMDRLL